MLILEGLLRIYSANICIKIGVFVASAILPASNSAYDNNVKRMGFEWFLIRARKAQNYRNLPP